MSKGYDEKAGERRKFQPWSDQLGKKGEIMEQSRLFQVLETCNAVSSSQGREACCSRIPALWFTQAEGCSVQYVQYSVPVTHSRF